MGNELTVQHNSLRALLEQSKGIIARALPRHLNADRMLAVATTAVQKTPALLECDRVSFVGAIIQCAQLGLEPNDGTGRAWLIPYGKQVQFVAGYRGLVDLTRRSGEIKRFDAREVYEKDTFSYSLGTRPDITHVPATGDRGKLTHVYAVAEFKDGGTQFDVMTADDVEKIRSRSKAGNSGPWKTDYAEMAKKTVVRRLCKMLPVSPETQRAVTLDERAELGLPQDLHLLADPDAKPTPEPPKYEPPKEKAEAPKDAPEAKDAEVVKEPTGENVVEFVPVTFSDKETRAGIKDDAGEWYSTFDKKLFPLLKEATEGGMKLRVSFKVSKTYKNIVTAVLA